MPLTGKEYTVRDFAKAANISYTTALKYIKRRYVKSFRRGGRRVIPKEEVERFLAEGNLREASSDAETAGENVQLPSEEYEDNGNKED